MFALALILLTTIAAVSFARAAAPSVHAIRLLGAGRYDDAERHLRRQLEGTVAGDPATYATRYNLAVALHRQGRFDESLVVLDGVPVASLDASLHGAANALYGWNLLHAGLDLPRAEQCLLCAGPLLERPTTQLGLAYLAYLRRDFLRGDAFFHRAVATSGLRHGMVAMENVASILIIDRAFERLIEEHLLGLCALERGDVATARAHLMRVAHTAHPSFYPRHAAFWLSRAGTPLLGGYAA